MSDEVNPKTSPFSVLPEGCIANIISLTSPKDACRLAAVSVGFKSAADSDTVWQRFLPLHCNEVVSRASPPLAFQTRKQLYFLLLDSTVLLDEGKLSYSLTVYGTSIMMSARALQIATIDNPRHWEWASLPSRDIRTSFNEVAKLQTINRLKIRGIMPARMLSPMTLYLAWCTFKFTAWDGGIHEPSRTSIKFVKKDGTEIEVENSIIHLQVPSNYDRTGRLSWTLEDDWYGIELGEFFVGDDVDDFDIHFEVSELGRLTEKKGLVIEGIDIEVLRT